MIEMRKFEPHMIKTVCCDSALSVLMRKILGFSIAFEKKYKVNLIVTRNADMVKEVIGYDLWKGMSTQFCY